MNSPKSITINVEISDDVAEGIMTTALEGGIGYWCKADITHGADEPLDPRYYESFVAYDTEEFDEDDPDKSELGVVTYDTIRDGIERILSGRVKVRGDLVAQVFTVTRPAGDEDIDADAADCIVQAGLLNEIRYG